MSSLGSRIRQVLQERGLKQSELAKIIGVKQQTISYICAPDSQANSSRYSAKIAQVLGVNPAWLQYGEGDKYDPVVRIQQGGVEINMQRVPLLTDEQAREYLASGEAAKPGRDSVTLMTDTQVSRGSFALVIGDDSMAPRFSQGDRVVIDPQERPYPGDFVAANCNDQIVFRKYRSRDGDTFELAPVNDDWPVLPGHNCKVAGVMVEHRNYRRRI